MISIKTEANKKLERAVMQGKTFMFASALSEGASIGYKSGNFFATACREGHLEIVEIFLLDHTFLKKGLLYHKELHRPSFHEGLTFAIARGKTPVVEFLMNNKTYNKLPDLERFMIEGMQYAALNNRVETLHYMLSREDVRNNVNLKDNIKEWDESAQINFSKSLLAINLALKLEKKQDKKTIKI